MLLVQPWQPSLHRACFLYRDHFHAVTGVGLLVPAKESSHTSMFKHTFASNFAATIWRTIAYGCDGQISMHKTFVLQ